MTNIKYSHDLRRIGFSMAVFEETIKPHELGWFRGAMISHSNGNPMFHNHKDEGFHYVYPRIQYKLLDGHPAVLGMEEGADAIKSMFHVKDTISCRLGQSTKDLHIASIGEWAEDVGLSDTLCKYRIENWLPLNSKNYREYQHAHGLIKRIEMLQGILTGNILSFATGLGIFFDQQVKCLIQDFECDRRVNYKGTELMSFCVTFTANVQLPQLVGIGKSASQSHGIVIRM